MIAIARAYSSNLACSVQGAVYHCLPELLLRKVFLSVIYANTNVLEKRFRILPDDSNDIFKMNILEKNVDRSD